MQWVINGYILALAAGFALGGRLADVLGSKRVVLIGIIGFAGVVGALRRHARRVRSRRPGSSCSGSSRACRRR